MFLISTHGSIAEKVIEPAECPVLLLRSLATTARTVARLRKGLRQSRILGMKVDAYPEGHSREIGLER